MRLVLIGALLLTACGEADGSGLTRVEALDSGAGGAEGDAASGGFASIAATGGNSSGGAGASGGSEGGPECHGAAWSPCLYTDAQTGQPQCKCDGSTNGPVPNGCSGASIAFFENDTYCAASDVSHARLYFAGDPIDNTPVRAARVVRCCCRYEFNPELPWTGQVCP